MRTDNRFLVLSTLGGLLTAASCTLITDVDRTKIPVDGGTPAEGGQGANGGSAGKAGGGGKGGSAGKGAGGAGGSSGASMGGESGGGGEAGGTSGSSGSSGTAGATGGSSGASGTGGSSGTSGTGGTDAGAGGEAGGGNATCGNGSAESGETCDDGNISACGTCAASCDVARAIPVAADAAFVIGALTLFMDGDTFTLDDGTNPPAIFEFECGPPDCTSGTTGVAGTNIAIPFAAVNFDGLNDETEFRDLVIAAIDAAALLTDAADGGSSPATVTLTNVEVITETVGNANFVTSQRCTGGIGCATDADCLSLSCDTTSQTCD